MKKEVNLFWILAVVVSVTILILSCLECVEGVSYSSLPISDTREPLGKSCNLFPLVSIPTVLSLIVLFFENKILNIFAVVTLFFQAIVVTLSNKVYKFIDDLFSYIGSISYTYKITNVGVIVSVLCWLLFLLTIVMTSEKLRTKKHNKANIKTTKFLITLLSIILALVSIPVLMFRIGIVIEISISFGLLFFFLTSALIFIAYYCSIKNTLKTNNRNYLWIMIAVITIFLIQIIFKDKIVDIWNDLFRTLYDPGNLPDALK